MKNKLKRIMLGVVCSVVGALGLAPSAFASTSFSVSPMNTKIILTPGEVYEGSFLVSNPNTNENDLRFEVVAKPFYVDDKYEINYNNNGDYNQIVDWVTILNDEGIVAPNGSVDIYYRIDVPEDAPAGGQYVAMTTVTKPSDAATGGININNVLSIAHIVYAEIAGTTERHGEIFGENVPSFVFSGDIIGSSSIKNTGNVHGTAKYTLQVFPLFSDEEVYTNEEEPVEKTILPDRTLYNETAWADTPFFGIFNVVYTVEFEGVTSQVKKMVIVCPIWLLFIVIFAIIMLIAWFVARSKSRKTSKK